MLPGSTIGMAPEDLRREFRRRGRWVTRFVINGRSYGGAYDAVVDPRVDLFFEHFAGARTILELGSLEGGHTINLARRPGVERVVGIEGRQGNLDRANWVKELYRAENVTFAKANLEEVELSQFGHFDAAFCSGVLYHLPEPWRLIEQISRVTHNLFIWTHYVEASRATAALNGLQGRRVREFGWLLPLSGLSAKSFWPTLASLTEMLERCDYEVLSLIEVQPDHPDGPAVTLAARHHL